jgi:SAM-dependent methyltransferase
MTPEPPESATFAQITREVCPGCGGPGPFTLWAEAKVDPAKLNDLAFASRKAPELMHHRLVTCPRCDLLLANPIPSPDAVGQAYHDAAFDSADEARCASRTYAGLVERVRASLPDSDGVLDIGTGEGSFLAELARRGFTGLAGVEPSAAPIAAASPEIRPLIRHELFDVKAFAPASFSLVTCFQTVEHVFEPAQLAREVLTLLKPGGAFLIVCHNRRGLSARILGTRSPIFDIEHMQLFSLKATRALLAGAGYERVRSGMIINRYPAHYWAKLLPLGGRKDAIVSRLRGSALGRATVPLPAGNQVAVGFRPAR